MPQDDPIPLSQVAGVSPDVVDVLAKLGILDAQQLAGVADVPGVGVYLAEALGLSASELADVVDGARRVAAPVQLPDTGPDPALGALRPTAEIQVEMRASQAPPAAPVLLPSSVNLIPKMQPVRDQGQRGTCVAFALASVHELHRLGTGNLEDLSEQFLYHEAKLVDGAPGVCGSWQMRAVGVLASTGVCRESIWGYNQNPPCNNNGSPPAGAGKDAARRKCQPNVLPPSDVQGAKTLLAAGGAVGLSIPVYASWFRSAAVRQSGRLTMRLGSEPDVGGHAVCLVGYQDDASHPGGGYFLLRNSWGVGWAFASSWGAGYGSIPYGYVAADAWELVAVR